MEPQRYNAGESAWTAYISQLAIGRRRTPLSNAGPDVVWSWAQPAVPRVVVPIGMQPAPGVIVEGEGWVLRAGPPMRWWNGVDPQCSSRFGCADSWVVIHSGWVDQTASSARRRCTPQAHPRYRSAQCDT